MTFPDTIAALWFQAESYTETEDGPFISALGKEMPLRVHAIRNHSGEIWDVINGWRHLKTPEGILSREAERV